MRERFGHVQEKIHHLLKTANENEKKSNIHLPTNKREREKSI